MHSLAALRVEKGLTQHQIAIVCGVYRETVTHWECGDTEPKLSHLVDYAHALGLRLTVQKAHPAPRPPGVLRPMNSNFPVGDHP